MCVCEYIQQQRNVSRILPVMEVIKDQVSVDFGFRTCLVFPVVK